MSACKRDRGEHGSRESLAAKHEHTEGSPNQATPKPPSNLPNHGKAVRLK
ncbi:leucine-rich repeat-containing protein 63 isoform X1 [Anopheles sinensis]|uniref:Leucine-rich repeat-containing protein 63 isoform X1 n=1 Tax=Anopheles sinensis TaxID=74873 RepID=A0A084VFG2_ANOSI|nr:leucine-rich repeat-containing protein 63 isoform X1 [Anopheles sinensis]